MVATAEAAANSAVTKLGFTAGLVVQEFGYDSDVDDDLRIAIEDVIGSELEDEDYRRRRRRRHALVARGRRRPRRRRSSTPSPTWPSAAHRPALPKSGRPGHVEASDIEEAALTAGLHASGIVSACADWTGTRLVAPKTARR